MFIASKSPGLMDLKQNQRGLKTKGNQGLFTLLESSLLASLCPARQKERHLSLLVAHLESPNHAPRASI